MSILPILCTILWKQDFLCQHSIPGYKLSLSSPWEDGSHVTGSGTDTSKITRLKTSHTGVLLSLWPPPLIWLKEKKIIIIYTFSFVFSLLIGQKGVCWDFGWDLWRVGKKILLHNHNLQYNLLICPPFPKCPMSSKRLLTSCTFFNVC